MVTEAPPQPALAGAREGGIQGERKFQLKIQGRSSPLSPPCRGDSENTAWYQCFRCPPPCTVQGGLMTTLALSRHFPRITETGGTTTCSTFKQNKRSSNVSDRD